MHDKACVNDWASEEVEWGHMRAASMASRWSARIILYIIVIFINFLFTIYHIITYTYHIKVLWIHKHEFTYQCIDMYYWGEVLAWIFISIGIGNMECFSWILEYILTNEVCAVVMCGSIFFFRLLHEIIYIYKQYIAYISIYKSDGMWWLTVMNIYSIFFSYESNIVG